MNVKTMKNIKSGELLFALIFFITSAFLISQLPDQVKWFKNTKITSQPALWCSIGLIGMTVFGFVHLILNIRLNNLIKDLKEGSKLDFDTINQLSINELFKINNLYIFYNVLLNLNEKTLNNHLNL